MARSATCRWYEDDTRMIMIKNYRNCSVSFSKVRYKVQWCCGGVDKMKRWKDIRKASSFPIWVTWLMWRWCFFYLGHVAVRRKLMKVSHGQMWHWQAGRWQIWEYEGQTERYHENMTWWLWRCNWNLKVFGVWWQYLVFSIKAVYLTDLY